MLPRHACTSNSCALCALALGAFAISTSEFASMGLMPLFADELALSLPQASNGITAYALGVTIGAPLLTVAAARVHRKQLLIALLVLACVANLGSAWAQGLPSLIVSRFLSGLPQGIYFGAASFVATRLVGADRAGRAVSLVFFGISVATIVGAPVGTYIGQQASWRWAFGAMALLGLLSAATMYVAIPDRDDLRGGAIRRELASLGRLNVWVMVVFTSFAVASLFAIYTFIDPLVTEVAGLSLTMTPVAQMVIGVGIALGALLGGGLADRYRFRALVGCLLGAMAAMGLLHAWAASPWGLMAMLFMAAFLLNAAVPWITV